ncbi:mis18-binding protein 1 [Brachyistius frenatus]|uniref:mis18-binding protein 1 n=1 Tax=Brachyistius frenatus TaxID=100188 RepID=UPI0037E76493
MASYYDFSPRTTTRFQSPAKIFSQLKSKLQMETMCAKDGVFARRDPLRDAREKPGAEFKSPRKKTTEERGETRRFREAQAATLSPSSSPPKDLQCSYSDIRWTSSEDVSAVSDSGFGRREGAFLESTAASQSRFPLRGDPIHEGPARIGDSGTPVKTRPGGRDRDKPASAAGVFSPVEKRLRKRKWEQLDFDKVSRRLEGVGSGNRGQPQRKKTSASADQSQGIREVMFPSPTTEKRCQVITESCLLMSPAKMFAYMKLRESTRKQQKVNNCTRELFNAGNIHQSRDAARSVGETRDITFQNPPESVVSMNLDGGETPGSQSDTDPSEDARIPAVPPRPVLLQDPLVLNSPQISIPKKRETVFKRNNQPSQAKFPKESVIYLRRWFLRKNRMGLFVEGIHREDNIGWNSNIIADRISNSVLKTVTGKVYILEGKMNVHGASGFPMWLLKKFAKGFPPSWKELYEKFLLESRNDPSRGTEWKNEGRGNTAKPKSALSSINQSVKSNKKKSMQTPDSCRSAASFSSKVSRSGRVIKPPLEYWKGGRVILDADMNVTIHECYATSTYAPEGTKTESARTSRKPIRACLPCSDGRKQSKSAGDKKASGPLRQVKVVLTKCTKASAKTDEKTSNSLHPPVETLRSPEEWSHRTTRSSRRCPATERALYVDAVPPKQSEPKKSSTQSSEKQTKSINRTVTISARESKRKQTVSNSPESPPVNEKTSEQFSFKKKKRVYSKEGRKVPHKLKQSPEESRKGLRRSPRGTNNIDKIQTQAKPKPSKSVKTSPLTNPSPKSTNSNQKHKANKGNAVTVQEEDEDRWAEEELLRLQQAVSYYPQHMAGYWAKVARTVGTRSAEECYNQHTSLGASQTSFKKARKPQKATAEAHKAPVAGLPMISARVGTLRRKQQVRQFLEAKPREDVDDAFSSAYMQNKRVEIPFSCPSDDHDVTLPDLEPLTPSSTCFPEVKSPHCLLITPGMMGSPNGNNGDKYVYQLQKRMKKNQFSVHKCSRSSKSFTPTPTVKRTMRRCGNAEKDSFVVWEMFPGNDGALSDSEEEEDFYFTDND